MKDSTHTPLPAIGTWKEQKVKLQEKFPTLTDTDLRYEEGKKNEMLAKI